MVNEEQDSARAIRDDRENEVLREMVDAREGARRSGTYPGRRLMRLAYNMLPRKARALIEKARARAAA